MKFDSRDPFETLAAVFLGDGGRESTVARSATSGMAESRTADHGPRLAMRSSSLSINERGASSLLRVTAAVAGHLPVMAGLWATQFADRVGTVDGPTGLLRCERDLVHVEVLRSGGRHIGMRQGESFEQWLSRAAQRIRRWVICLSAHGDPAEVLDPGFAERVLLTSADEAAVAAARRVIAAIDESAVDTISIGVVVVGAPPERASWMVDQLASQAHRAIDLPLAGSIQRMDRVDSSERYGFEVPQTPRAVDLLRLLHGAAEQAVDRLGDGFLHPLRRPPTAAREVESLQTDPAPAEPSTMPPSAASPVRAPEIATVEPVARAESPKEGPRDLAPAIAGMTAMGMRCPVADAVELATDARGRLHLVAPIEAMGQLRSARAWAATNASLLKRAFPNLGEPIDGGIVERVVTRDAAAVESLHGSGVALDLFVEIVVGSTTVMHHVPLNALARSPVI